MKQEISDRGADQIILTKWAGMEGSCILAYDREDLREVFPETILMRMRGLDRYLSVRKEAEICAENGAQHLVDLSEGGIFAALWRLSVKARRGFVIDLMDIPVLQETIEFANHYDIDPYRLKSGGSLLAVTGDADALIGKLWSSGIPAARIGELREDRDKILRNEDEIRYLDLPQPDELRKIMV
jgi:hydrogenase maturation factor